MATLDKHKFTAPRDYFAREEFAADEHRPKGSPRPREASFIPDGVRKDIKVKMRHKQS